MNKQKEKKLMEEIGITEEDIEDFRKEYLKVFDPDKEFEELKKVLEETRKKRSKDYKPQYDDEFYELWDKGLIA
ncbi:MAG: hypothetical protein ACE5KT_02030 [Methanosarcinales archaeon]